MAAGGLGRENTNSGMSTRPRRTIAAVMGHYNRIARELAEHPEDYAPVLEIDPNGGETLWEPWIDGFERAMRLRPDAWEEIALSDDEEASASVSMIVALNDFYYGRSELTEEAEDELDRMAPGLIPEFVRNLNDWTKSRQFGKGCRDGAGFHARSAHDNPPGIRAQGGAQRALPVRLGPKIQALAAARTDRGMGDDGIVIRRGILMEWTPPPDGIAMCQIGGVINAKWKERRSWKRLSLLIGVQFLPP